MAESAPRQSDHSHCSNCVKIKEERCLETKRALEQCANTQEEARLAKESLLAEQLEEAKTKIQSMQKTLMAFQIATTVGVTILGQEVFDKIMGKVDQVKQVQEKITGSSTTDHKDEKPGDKKQSGKSVSMGGNDFSGLYRSNKHDYRDLQFSDKLVITTDKPEQQNAPWIPETIQVATSDVKTEIPLIIDPPVTPPTVTVASVTNYDFPIIMMSVPELLATVQYPLLPFQDDSFVFGQGAITPIPTPSPISVFALGLINQPRRRMA